jgi:tetratricopeptide (TPR) repeat protein
MQDYYQILGISPEATSGQIKAAYRRLALRYHPDRNPHDIQAENNFVRITEAYEVLSNPVKRTEYDLGQVRYLEDEQINTTTRRPPPPHYYYNYKPEKKTYSRRDYAMATSAVFIMIVIAVVVPIYLLQMTSDKYYNLAISNYFAGKYYSALHNVDLSIKDLSSNNDEACALASVILVHKLGKYDFALRYIERGLEYDPEDSLASEFNYMKGLCYANSAKPNEALQYFGQVGNYSHAYDSSLYHSAAILLFYQSKLDTAELLLNELIQRNKFHFGANYLKGIIYEKRSNPEQAYKIFKFLSDKPFNKAATYYHLAQSEIKLNLMDSACHHLKIACDYNLLEAKRLKSLYCDQMELQEASLAN